MFKKDIDRKKRILLAVALVVVRLVLAESQMIFIQPGSAPIDDDLYFRMANSIVSGNWLGEYDYLTLSKYPLFAVYLAGLHLLGIPYLRANCLVWAAVCAVCVWAFAPVIKNNIYRLGFFAFMLFNPYSFNHTTLRVYRDSLFYMMCILFFAGMIGWAFRLKAQIKSNVVFLAIAGVGLAASWTSREDGYWLLPFFVAAVVICAVYILIGKQLKNKVLRLVSTAIPAVITCVAVLSICSINYRYYNVFTISDFDDGSFAQFFGGMTRIPHENWRPMVSVPEDVREKVYDNCPSLVDFRDWLESEDSRVRRGHYSPDVGDYKSGSLYWAIRRVADELGMYESRHKADLFWQQAAQEVNALCDKYPDSLPPRASLTPPIRAEYVAPVVQTAFESMVYVATWQDITPYERALSDMTTGRIEMWETFLKEKSNYSAIEHTSDPYHTTFQSFCYKIMELIVWLYRLLTLVLLPVAVFAVIKGFATFKKQSEEKQLLLFILLGLVAMAVFRIFIISFMEVAAFGIGIYSMYLAVAYPVMTMVCAVAPLLLKNE